MNSLCDEFTGYPNTRSLSAVWAEASWQMATGSGVQFPVLPGLLVYVRFQHACCGVEFSDRSRGLPCPLKSVIGRYTDEID